MICPICMLAHCTIFCQIETLSLRRFFRLQIKTKSQRRQQQPQNIQLTLTNVESTRATTLLRLIQQRQTMC